MVTLVFWILVGTALFLEAVDIFLGWGALLLACLSALLYFVNSYLTMRFIKKNAPGVLEIDILLGKPPKGGEYLWEKTAGTGVVPKWVSFIGIFSYACFIGTVIWLIIWLITWLR